MPPLPNVEENYLYVDVYGCVKSNTVKQNVIVGMFLLLGSKPSGWSPDCLIEMYHAVSLAETGPGPVVMCEAIGRRSVLLVRGIQDQYSELLPYKHQVTVNQSTIHIAYRY